MEQLAAFPQESWQPVVCRICRHPFAVAVEDVEAAPITLCQVCTLLVDWFGQDEAEPPKAAPTQPAEVAAPPPPVQTESARAATLPKRAHKPAKKARQQEQLGSLLERWGDLWHTGEEHE